jgi:hypothetical protein
VRGGGRGVGVVTSFEFDLHPLGPDVALAQVIYHFHDAERILRAWPRVALDAPETVTPQLLIWTIPPDPAFPVDGLGRDEAVLHVHAESSALSSDVDWDENCY